MNIVLVFSTAPDRDVAQTLADALVQEKLAACVSLLPGVQSTYRWEGRVETSSEVMLLIKTTEAAYPRLEARLQALHPYELPEIVAIEGKFGLPGYLSWVAAETASTLENK